MSLWGSKTLIQGLRAAQHGSVFELGFERRRTRVHHDGVELRLILDTCSA